MKQHTPNGRQYLEATSLNTDEIYINIKQNKPESLRLLAAMRVLYSEAKFLRSMRVMVTVMLPIISLLCLKYFPGFKEELAFIAGIWLIVNRIFLAEKEKRLVKEAATIQENFDTDVFQLPWNALLVGEKISLERILNLNGKSLEKEEKLIDWYPGLTSTHHVFNVLLAQKTNLHWDIEQRKIYKNILQWVLIIYIVFVIAISFLLNLPTQTMIISFLVPSLPLILHLIEIINSHKQRYESLARVFPKVTSDIENYSSVNAFDYDIRGYQDIVFLKRCDVNMVPDKLYWLKRNVLEKISKESNQNHSKNQNTSDS